MSEQLLKQFKEYQQQKMLEPGAFSEIQIGEN